MVLNRFNQYKTPHMYKAKNPSKPTSSPSLILINRPFMTSLYYQIAFYLSIDPSDLYVTLKPICILVGYDTKWKGWRCFDLLIKDMFSKDEDWSYWSRKTRWNCYWVFEPADWLLPLIELVLVRASRSDWMRDGRMFWYSNFVGLHDSGSLLAFTPLLVVELLRSSPSGRAASQPLLSVF